jgi:hypothetical protein
VLELAEVIRELRGELQRAMAAGAGEALRFELGPVELEATVGLEKEGTAGARVRFWVLELGGDAKATQSTTQLIKLRLDPHVAASGARPWVSGEDTGRER